MMEKKALQLASVASMIDQFNIPNIQILQSLGYHVDVVADFTNPGTIPLERAAGLKKRLRDMDVRVFDIAVPRSLNPGTITSAYKQVKKLITKEHYNLIHCHSPIGGVICRQAAKDERRKGTKVIYTAHGFHFYDGAPFKNWIVFYPIELWLSRYTDVLITINQEDYRRAKKRFHAAETVSIPGVGVPTEKFLIARESRDAWRKKQGIADDDVVFLSVGELNANKNHALAISALAWMRDHGQNMRKMKYFICGIGNLESDLKILIAQSGLNETVRLLGFREDVADLYGAADIFLFLSKREGLPMSLMEAMACGLPCIGTDTRGIRDLIKNNENGYICGFMAHDVADKMRTLMEDKTLRRRQSRKTLEMIKKYDIRFVENKMKQIYERPFHREETKHDRIEGC